MIIKNIDGLNVVIGFDKALIDSVETQKIVRSKIKKYKSFRDLKVLGAQHASMSGLENRDKEKLKEIKGKIREATNQFNKDVKDVYNNSKSFFEPKAGESVIEKDIYEDGIKKLKKAAKNGNVLIFNDNKFTEVENNVGESYYDKIDGKVIKSKISKLGVPFPSTKIKNPTIANINEASGGAMKDTELISVLNASIRMKAELEIKGTSPSESLTQSRQWYAGKVADVDSKYV